MTGPGKIFSRIIETLASVLQGVATVCVAALMCLVVFDVIRRSIFSVALIGATELAEMFFVCMISAIAAVALKNDHIMVDTFVVKMPRVVRRWVILAMNSMAIFICVMLARGTYSTMMYA